MPGLFVSRKSKQSVFKKFRDMKLHNWRKPITELAEALNPITRGLHNYYEKFWKGMMSMSGIT